MTPDLQQGVRCNAFHRFQAINPVWSWNGALAVTLIHAI
ncbi:hypothetical protein XAP6164_220001 [Xanthomonas phaseoli pv. phaseoli]|nr:hypothetical protein XAP6164_220001 [Xanthomonas phaseoli pv. phaseoli]